MKVKVIGVSKDDLWYEESVGNVFDVYELDELPMYFIIPIPAQFWKGFYPCLFLVKKDCEALS